MKISIDAKWKLPPDFETDDQYHPEPPSPLQHWRVIGPHGEVLGKISARFSDDELAMLGYEWL